ncbi:transporter substrate-binding domain-containing protein [Metabacillus malikii]|uniref:Polar amino acid transport system substrate-binding protein n=1 Tax=Metabacillus malikii TaxID=1504265 RepID=A0ABT9ZHY0_9BACI|nr:transporter substrate-binding domain-containing protein [Metabacillus malikii]MDQ0231896.1 polar amino acid transport system substrate-binding protein [Metabacillus malikii]
MKKFTLVFISFLMIGFLAACGANSDNTNGSEKKVLKMATSADYPPFEYIDTAKSSDIIGFDIDLAKALAEKTGYTLQIQDMDFNSLIPALQAKQIDVVLAGMSKDPEREKNVDFSDVYFTANHMIVSLKDKEIKSVDEFNGKTIGVQLGSIQEEKANELAKEYDIKIENRNKISDLVQELKSGRIDAAIIEDLVAEDYFKNDQSLTGFTLEEANEEGYAMAFQKDAKLTKEFNDALVEMKESGELDKLVKKWLGDIN